MIASRRTGPAALLVLVVATAGAAPPAEAPAIPNTPEGVFKAFFLAMATADEATLREVAIPAEHFEILFTGDHIPPDRLAEFRKLVDEKLQPRLLKAGEELKGPGGRVVVIKADEVDDDHAVVTSPFLPLPNRCVRVDGRWKVDPRPIIAGRQAAEKARKSREAGGTGPKAESPGP